MHDHFKRSVINRGTCVHFQAFSGPSPLTFGALIRLWANADAEWLARFEAALLSARFEAFRWELPSLSPARIDCPVEFVLVNASYLEVSPDAGAFASYFDDHRSDLVVSFQNLGHDALLVVPRPLDSSSGYAHLGAFVRQAPQRQKAALWRRVGIEAMRRLEKGTPFWINTAGTGVPWLHVRLDDRPKYYVYEPYRSDPDGLDRRGRSEA